MNILVIPLAFAFAQPADGLIYSHMRAPFHGTLLGSELHGFFGKDPVDFGLYAIPIDRASKQPCKIYWLHVEFSPIGRTYRHAIKFNSLWISTGDLRLNRLKFEELALYDSMNPKAKQLFLNSLADLRSGPPYRMVTQKLAEKCQKKLTGVFDPVAKDVLGYGSTPTSETSCKCYFLRNQNHFEIWDTLFTWDHKKKIWNTTNDGKNLESIKCPFAEDFYFFLQKSDYYFVTQSGKLYHAPPANKGEKSRKMTALWDDAERPITAIIEDADNNKVWLFAKNTKDAKRGYYFEMKSSTTFETFDPTKLKRVNIEGRARMLLELLPLIRKDAKKASNKGS